MTSWSQPLPPILFGNDVREAHPNSSLAGRSSGPGGNVVGRVPGRQESAAVVTRWYPLYVSGRSDFHPGHHSCYG